MKYQQALQQKGIGVENLSKSLQGQIEKLMKGYEKVEKALSADLSEEEMNLIEEAKRELAKEEESLVIKISNFNPELQERRKAIMAEAIKARDAKKAKSTTTTNNNNTNPKETSKSKPPVAKNNVSVQEKLDEIKKDIKEQPIVTTNTTQQQPVESVETKEPQHVQQHQEFERVQDVKKKRNGLWFALIGVGAVVLTWGTVNVFKNK